ncbi:MAG: LuxR C-terminal-related transcriptional regulator, partial [Gaiellales bacterium]
AAGPSRGHRAAVHPGDWPAALRNSDAAYEATLQSAQEIERIFVLTTSALVASCLGSVEHARETAQEALDTAERLHSRPAALEALSVLGFLELSLGRLAEAAQIFDGLGHAVAAAGFGEPGLNFRFGADEIEALVGLGRLEDAETRLALLDGQGRSLDRPWALATAARGRGLLRAARGDVRGALSELDRALDEHERLGEPFELGRTLLVRGITARRDKQKAAARADLERARERIAELVAEGLSNKEVAAALFVSPKTVEWNLTKIYRKLGVRSRGQLATHVRRGDGP